MTPAAGHYNIYWRNPETRVFETIPGIHLVGKTEDKKIVIRTNRFPHHWYTKAPGPIASLAPAWKRWEPK